MGLTFFVVRAALFILCSSACGERGSSVGNTIELPNADSVRVSIDSSAHALVLGARELDRANQRDSARVAYLDAARRLPDIADWLYLRAAGVTTDSAERQNLYEKIRTDVARDRIAWSEALARERSGDIQGAIKAFESAGGRISAFRLRLAVARDEAAMALIRTELLGLMRSNIGFEMSRDAIAMFDATFRTPRPAEQLTIARTAALVGLNARAANAYSAAARAGLLTARDRFSYGGVLARLNRDTEAAAQYARVTTPPALAAAARYQRARAQIALRNITGARTTLRSITTRWPRDTTSASALLLLADLASDEGRDSDARSTLRDIAARFPSSRHAPVAMFRGALASFVNRDMRSAAAEFESLVARYPRSSDANAARYWGGRAWHAFGDTAKSRAAWTALLRAEPSSYYAVMSARRLDAQISLGDPALDTVPRIPALDSGLTRIAFLRDLGMEVEERHEYDRLFRDASRSTARMIATAHVFAGTQQASRSIALGWRVIEEFGRSPLRYRLVFPVLEREKLASSSSANGLDPALVAALIKQESSFNPRATSPVGARGIMQIMPDLGARMARQRGITDWHPDMLYRPEVSIDFGTAHLAGLLRDYPNIVYGLAAYNAGETPVARWRQKAGANDPELFTERIPFVETRDYVRSILRNREFYQALYPW